MDLHCSLSTVCLQSKTSELQGSKVKFMPSCTILTDTCSFWNLPLKEISETAALGTTWQSTRAAAYSNECNSLPSPFLVLLWALAHIHNPPPPAPPPNSTTSNNAKMKEVPTFAALRQFRVAAQVTCHNSGKSLWLDLQANSWHGMVEWQRLRLTLSTLRAAEPKLSTDNGAGFTQGPKDL